MSAPRLPGDPTPEQLAERVLRVDHAGEVGAVRIYEGQLAILGSAPSGDTLRAMKAKEEAHRDELAGLLAARGVRPTALAPLWDVAGFALGAATALLGPKAAMAATVAVEEVIEEHYRSQREALVAAGTEPELASLVERFGADESAHKDEALAHGAREAPGYELLTSAIKAGSRLAIWLSTRI
ncbi:MAG: demethoxyubiquinone hydroxylase family protein [Gemmatimonas sp.]